MSVESTRTERMGALFDYFVMSPDGVTVEDMMEHLDCSLDMVNVTIRDLRLLLGDTDTANLTCNPGAPGARHIYRLVTDFDDHRQWLAKRVLDMESRINTIHAILASALAGSDGRTLEGKRVKVMHKQLGRLLEDLAEVHIA